GLGRHAPVVWGDAPRGLGRHAPVVWGEVPSWFGETCPCGLGRRAPWFGETITTISHCYRKDFSHWTFKKTSRRQHTQPRVCGMTLVKSGGYPMVQSLTSTSPRVPQQTTPPPLSILRTETVLSRFPIHTLAKRGRVAIVIKRMNAQGELDLRWDVSYN